MSREWPGGRSRALLATVESGDLQLRGRRDHGGDLQESEKDSRRTASRGPDPYGPGPSCRFRTGALHDHSASYLEESSESCSLSSTLNAPSSATSTVVPSPLRISTS